MGNDPYNPANFPWMPQWAAGLNIPGGVFGLPSEPLVLPPSGQTKKFEFVNAGLGNPIPLAYGRHIVGGNLAFSYEYASGTNAQKTAQIYLLGEGEWDAIEWLEVNGRRIDHTDTSIVHFHPGIDGEVGTEAAPGTRNQKQCSLWPSIAPLKVHFSRTAYLALLLDPDPGAPTAGFVVRGIYRTVRVRIFNSSGTQTSYEYSANNAWIALDLIIRRYLKPRGLVNEALTAAEKAFVNFSAFKTWADDCDVDIGGGKKRWEAHVASIDQTDLKAALQTVLALGRATMLELAGQFAPQMMKSRASVITLTSDMLAPGSLSLGRKATRENPNRYVAKFRQLDSGTGAGTIATTGTTLTGTTTKFTQMFREGSQVRLEDGAQLGELREVASITSDTAAVLAVAFSTNQSGRKFSNPALDFQPRVKYFEDEARQDETGRINELELDLGNNSSERVERLVRYMKSRAALERTMNCRLLAGSGVEDLFPEDVITGLDSPELDPAGTRLFKILQLEAQADGSFGIACEEEDLGIYGETAGAQQDLAGLPPISTPVSITRLISPNFSYRPLTNPLSAADVGATATVSISAHTMRFPGIGASINSGSIAALAFNTLFYIFYDDPDFNGGTVTYGATTTKETALNGAARFFVGSIVTPIDGGPDVAGNNDGGAGAQVDAHIGVSSPSAHTISGTVNNPANAYDKGPSTYAEIVDAGGSPAQEKVYTFGTSPAFFTNFRLVTRTGYYHSVFTTETSNFKLEYSTNGGSGWTTIYDITPSGWAGGVSYRDDRIVLLPTIDLSQLQVRFTVTQITSVSATGRFYEAWVEAAPL